MKLKDDYITQDMDDEQIMVSTGTTGFSGLVRSNSTAAFIVNCLKTDTTREKIAEAMSDRYAASREEIENGIDDILNKLQSIGALSE